MSFYSEGLRDSNNDPFAGCATHLRQYMPGMGMALDNPFVLLIEQGNKGTYRARNAEFSMGSDWVIEFELECGDESYKQGFSYHLEWPE